MQRHRAKNYKRRQFFNNIQAMDKLILAHQHVRKNIFFIIASKQTPHIIDHWQVRWMAMHSQHILVSVDYHFVCRSHSFINVLAFVING